MKKIVLAAASAFMLTAALAQQTEGKVVYKRTMQMQIQLSDNNDPIQQMLPKVRTDNFELSFGNNQSLWVHAEDEVDNNELAGGGMQIKMVAPGQNDVVFHDFTNSRKIEQREMMDKKFIIEDSIRKLNWKLSDETATYLGHLCHKATAQRFGQRTQMTMDNGKMERKLVNDTTEMVAWFTTDIPVSAGPEVQGQLPGLILYLDMNKGRMVYQAVELSPKVNLSGIKAPTKGKKVTSAEFTAETTKMMEDMQKNFQGGNGNKVIIRN
jgi:GLPGLI family protein